MANAELDIHKFGRQLANVQACIKARGVTGRTKTTLPITARNADLILQYDQTRALEGIRPPTRVAEMIRLLEVARALGETDVDKASKDDIKALVVALDAKYSTWTRVKLRMTFRRFFKWLRQGDEYRTIAEFPEEVRWIKRGLNKNDLVGIKRGDCWTEEEERQLVAAAEHPRDRAFLSLLTETGARIGEIGNLRVGDVFHDEFGFLIHVRGKTGERESRVIYSGPCLADWLNMHPKRADPNAPLFVRLHDGATISYNALGLIIHTIAKRAGLAHKKLNAHIFRHSRATMLGEQGWPEPLIKEYLGWTKDSTMMATYSHLTSRNANRYLLKAHGLAAADSTQPKLKLQVCASCHQDNGAEATFCRRCTRPLTHEAILNYNQERTRAGEILNDLVDDPDFRKILSEFVAKRRLALRATTPPA